MSKKGVGTGAGIRKLYIQSRGTRPDRKPGIDTQKLLYFAAQAGNHNLVEKVLEQHPTVNVNYVCGENNTTALWIAAFYGKERVVALLINRPGTNPNIEDTKFHQTPLLIAVTKNHLNVVDKILEGSNVNINSKDKLGRNALLIAAAMGHSSMVTKLLTKRTFDVNSRDDDKFTPLILAAWGGHIRVVELLLERDNIDPKSKDKNDRTALWWAAAGGYVTILNRLLESKVEPNAKDNKGQTPLSVAAQFGRIDIVRELLKKAQPGYTDTKGRTPLSWATHREEDVKQGKWNKGQMDKLIEQRKMRDKGRVAVVEELLKIGVKVDRKDDEGRTPLSWAAGNGKCEIAKLLMSHKADPVSEDNECRTPLSWAAAGGHTEVVKLLLEKYNRTNLEIECRGQKSPLLLAAQAGHPSVTELLLGSMLNKSG